MGKVAYHVEKGLDSSGGLGHHIDRTEGQEHTYPHADLSRVNLNRNFELNKYCKMSLPDAVNERIKDGYNNKRKIRTDAVKFLSHILSGTHEDMLSIFADEKKKEEWIKANYEFLKDQYGADNIVRFSLHLDEKTPHIHAITIPLTKEGKLSAKEVLGNRIDLQNKQTKYSEYMKPFGLERGELGSTAKHESLDEYRRRESQIALKVNEPIEIVEKKNIFSSSIDKDATIDKLKEDIKTHRVLLEDSKNKAIKMVDESVKGLLRAQKELKKDNQNLSEKLKESNEKLILFADKLLNYQELTNQIILNPKASVEQLLNVRLQHATEVIKEEIKEDIFKGKSIANADDYLRKHIPAISPLFKDSMWQLLENITKDRSKYEDKLWSYIQDMNKEYKESLEQKTSVQKNRGFKY